MSVTRGRFEESARSDGAAPADARALISELWHELEELRATVETKGRVGIAVGIVMMRHDVNEVVAFDLIVKTSRAREQPLVEVAEQVIRQRSLVTGP